MLVTYQDPTSAVVYEASRGNDGEEVGGILFGLGTKLLALHYLQREQPAPQTNEGSNYGQTQERELAHDKSLRRGKIPDMLKSIRLDPEAYKSSLARRHETELLAEVNELLVLDKHRRNLQVELDELRAERNRLSKEARSHQEAAAIRPRMSEINERREVLEDQMRQLEEDLTSRSLHLPNQLAPEVPDGQDETDNRVVKQWGSLPKLVSPQEHGELGTRLGILDFELTAHLVGARFSSFLGEGAALMRALANFMLVEATAAGYRELNLPAMVGAPALRGTGQLPKFAEDQYRLAADDKYLIPTAEVPLTGFFATSRPSESELPMRLCAHTPCFRREAGSASRDTRGIIRQHQFEKVELVHICRPEDSRQEHEYLVQHAEALLEKLALPYQRVELCGGDIWFAARHCFDLEVWFPSQGAYREISSCSDCGDFQAQRLNFRYKTAAGKSAYVHTLNGSGLALGRTWAAILENYQAEDGKSVRVPEALQGYLGRERIGD
jgi:seryl-tRNA synthetase